MARATARDSGRLRGSSMNTENVSFRYPEWMDESVESQLGYGDSKSEWIREAVRQRLEREGLLDD